MNDEGKKYPVKMDGWNRREIESYSPYEYVRYVERESDEEINVKEYLDILIRRKWLIIICLFLTISVGVFITITTKPLYNASATVEIRPDIPNITTFKDFMEAERSQSVDYHQTQYNLIKSYTLGEIVLKNIKSKHNKKNIKTKNDDSLISNIKSSIYSLIAKEKSTIKKRSLQAKPKRNNLDSAIAVSESEVRAFLSRINVVPVGNTSLAKISYVSDDPVYASMAANTIVDSYIDWLLQRRVGTSKSAREFLETQLDELKVKIEKAEENLSNYAKTVDIVSLNKDIDLNYKKLVEITEQLSQLETELVRKKTLFNEVKSGNYSYLPEVVQNPRVQQLSSEYANLKTEYNNMTAIYGPNYPDVQQISSRLSGVESQLKSTLANIAESIKRDYQSTLDRQKILEEKLAEKKQNAIELDAKAIQYRILEREIESNKKIYDDLLQRLKETEVTSAIKDTNVQVVDYATVPRKPFKPNFRTNLLYSIMVGLMMGTFISFGLEFFNTKIRDEEELKKKFPYIPYLGAVPQADESDIENLEKIVDINPRSAVTEAFRVIRTSILYSSPDYPPKIMLVTSSQPIEGKTTLCSNLAISMKQTNRKTLIIDADLRKPRLHKILANNGNKGGLSTYLVGKESLENIKTESNVSGLDFIASGPIPPNPAELLGSKKMKDLLEILSKQYEYIIIDGAPITGFADSRLLSRLVDGVLLVTSVGITQKATLKNSIDELFKVRAKIIGTVVNRLDTTRDKYNYNYYYYYTNEQSVEDSEKRSISPGSI